MQYKFNQHLSITKKTHTHKSQTGITHIAFSEELPGEEMSLGLGGGCNWLKNSSTCNLKFNQHLSIAKKHTQKSQTGITHIAFSEELPGEDCPEAKTCEISSISSVGNLSLLSTNSKHKPVRCLCYFWIHFDNHVSLLFCNPSKDLTDSYYLLISFSFSNSFILRCGEVNTQELHQASRFRRQILTFRSVTEE